MRDAPDRIDWEEQKAGGFDLRLFLDPHDLGVLLSKLTVVAALLALAVSEALQFQAPTPATLSGFLGRWFLVAATGGFAVVFFVATVDEYIGPATAPRDWRFDNKYAEGRRYPWVLEHYFGLWAALMVAPLVLNLATPLPDVVLAMLTPTLDLGIGLWAVAKYLAGYVVGFVGAFLALMVTLAGAMGWL